MRKEITDPYVKFLRSLLDRILETGVCFVDYSPFLVGPGGGGGVGGGAGG